MILLILSASLAQEPIFSMMLSPEERGVINPVGSLVVNAILYESDELWSVWINGKRYKPEDVPTGFFIRRVTEQEVELDLEGEIITLAVGNHYKKGGQSESLYL